MPKLTIDGREVEVAEGTTVIQAAEELGIFIPRYCYHPGLSIAGNCRICLVQVDRIPKLQVACNLPVGEGMVVQTQSEEAEAGRKSVLEFLLANHPLDCPVCDQAGECDLQNFYMNFGLYDPRFREHKVKKKKAVRLGEHVMLDQERCILCSRCVRFTDEITGTGELGIFNRGDRAEVGVYPGDELNNPYSANVVDICPVGALTERNFRFKTRVWYLSSAPTICNGCSRGCNIDMHYVLDRPHLNDGARVVRIKPRINPDVNKWWLCDEGRYGLGWLDQGRQDKVRGPVVAATNGHADAAEATWEQALATIFAALEKLRSEARSTGVSKVAVIASAQLSTEELFLIKKIFADELGAQVSASVPERPGSADDFLVQADKNPNTAGATLLGLTGEGSLPADEIVQKAIAGQLDFLWVFGQDLVELYSEQRIAEMSQALKLFVVSDTNVNQTTALAHWALPSAAYVEKDGTFINCEARVQRIGQAFPPYGDSREDWRILLALAESLGIDLGWKEPRQVFAGMVLEEPAFAGLTYAKIGEGGAPLATSAQPSGVAAP